MLYTYGMSMIKNIAKDVANNIRETDSLDLILTTGLALKDMFIKDEHLQDKGLYLVKFNTNGSVNSYYLLKDK